MQGCGKSDPAVSTTDNRIATIAAAATQQSDMRATVKEIEDCYQKRYENLRDSISIGIGAVIAFFAVISILSTYIAVNSNKELKELYEQVRQLESDTEEKLEDQRKEYHGEIERRFAETQTELDKRVAEAMEKVEETKNQALAKVAAAESQALLETAGIYHAMAATGAGNWNSRMVFLMRAVKILSRVRNIGIAKLHQQVAELQELVAEILLSMRDNTSLGLDQLPDDTMQLQQRWASVDEDQKEEILRKYWESNIGHCIEGLFGSKDGFIRSMQGCNYEDENTKQFIKICEGLKTH